MHEPSAVRTTYGEELFNVMTEHGYTKNESAKVTLFIVVAFAIYYITAKVFFHPLQSYLFTIFPNQVGAFVLTYLLVGLPLFVATCLINKKGNVFRSLGLTASPWIGLVVGVLCTLPMFIGYAWLAGGLASGLSITLLITNNLLAGVFEETYFRGFLFGQLFRHTQMGFIPAIVLCSVLFASGHLYQSTDPKVLLGVLLTTFIGSIWFAWLYVEWGYNIWVPVCLHSFMDASWYLFDAGSNALGGVGANVFRLMTVALAILLTIIHKRRTKQPFFINNRTIWRGDAKGYGLRVLEGTDTRCSAGESELNAGSLRHAKRYNQKKIQLWKPLS
jgi:membrane protease YdiL (CAAX protease family)